MFSADLLQQVYRGRAVVEWSTATLPLQIDLGMDFQLQKTSAGLPVLLAAESIFAGEEAGGERH
jgi:hypothetical protein